MRESAKPLILSRRGILMLAGTGLVARRSLDATTDFWNKKAPSEWTSEEIDHLVTNSPWAKQVTTEYEPGERAGGYPDDTGYPGGGSPGGGGGYPGGGTGGGYPGGGYPGGGMGSPRVGIGR